jgi:hypothetical protein
MAAVCQKAAELPRECGLLESGASGISGVEAGGSGSAYGGGVMGKKSVTRRGGGREHLYITFVSAIKFECLLNVLKGYREAVRIYETYGIYVKKPEKYGT